jgi:hypothetical protein
MDYYINEKRSLGKYKNAKSIGVKDNPAWES